MSKRAWIIFAGICVLVLGSLVYVSNQNRVDVSKIDVSAIQQPAEASGLIGDHVYGKTDSKVVLIEYGDFQCPGCGSAHPTVKELSEKYKDQLTFVFRNFPITNIHPNARVAAAAAEAAGLQGEYWEMHNKIYENQSSWSNLSSSDRTGFFVNYASELGLDTGKFTQDLAGEAVSKKINFDQALGKKAGTDATPTFFLNGKKLDNEWNDKERLETLLVDAMKTEGITLPQ